MPTDDPSTLTRCARRWADAAWVREWYAHAIDVLDRALELNPTCFKLHRKRGTYLLLCPDPTVRDEEQAFADLRRACELSGWREDVARRAIALLTGNGDVAQANELTRELAARGATGGERP